jgi:patatin-related protein
MTAAHSGGADGQPPSELRLAVTFTGGVSLAVWMGGIAREMNLLLAASRKRHGETTADTTEPGTRVRDGYAALLDFLNLDCSLDVLSGTSAGGINAVILGLANVQRFDLDGLRELWFKEGSLGNLLRDPADKQPASLLYGDKSLLQGLQTGLTTLAGSDWAENPASAADPTRVFITTTLLAGQACRFTDDYGTLVRDVDHHGLFSFTSAQLTRANVPALALAARCSASFPMAFEPGLIPIGTDAGDGHPDMAPFTGGQVTQFAADGGLLANRPLGPALQAVFDRPADRDVRRVLAYVVPMLGGSGLPNAKLTLADTPGLEAALRADVGAMLSQTISGDIAAIAAHNQQVRARNDTRQQLALLGTQMERLGAPFWGSYCAQRARSLASAASDEVLRRTTVAKRAADGRPTGFGADAEHALDAAHSAVQQVLPVQLPAIADYEGMNAAGREALDDGRATVLAILSRAFQLVSSAATKDALGQLRARASNAMPGRPDASQADTVTRALGVPDAAGDAPGAMAAAGLAATAARALLDANMAASPALQPWRELATVVIGLRDQLAVGDAPAVSPGDGADNSQDSAVSAAAMFVKDLVDYLTGPTGGNDADTVAGRLFDLHVARHVMQPDGVIADQALELVQMSSDTRTGLDRRTLAREKLTGLQLHHFGAFYKASWRANDWMWGRLDGAGWLVHVLLDPRRLHQLALEASDSAVFRANLRVRLEQIAGSPAPLGVWEPFASHAGRPGAAAEMDFLTVSAAPPPPPTSLPVTAMWVAGGLQRIIAGEELAHVAEQIEKDTKAGAQEDTARAFVSAYRNATGAAAAGSYPEVPEGKAADVLHACRVSAEKLTSEMGSKLFTTTVTRAAAVSVKVVDTAKLPTFLRPMLTGARTATSLAYRVTSVGAAARYPLIAGLTLIALGVLASTSTIKVLSAAGLAAVLAGLLLVAVGAARRIMLALAISAVAAGAALAAAAYIPFLRDHLFPWLEKTAVPSLAKHPAQWAILVVFVLLPPLWTIVVIIQRVFRVRTKAPARRTTTTVIAAATPEPEPSLAKTS